MTKIVVLYPADFFNANAVDEAFLKESCYLRSKNIVIGTVTDTFKLSLKTDVAEDTVVIYRGWMLTPEQYSLMYAKTGRILLTTPEQYKNSHYISQWVKPLRVAGLTPSTSILYETDIDRICSMYSALELGKVFVKDFVKSLKTKPGPIVHNSIELRECLTAMTHFRGCIEGGVAFRTFVSIEPNSEKRVFVVDSKIFGRLTPEYEEAANKAISVLNAQENARNFYSLDLAKDSNGNVFTVEIGDGQVSDFEADHLSEGVSIEEFSNAVLALTKRN